MAYDRADFDYSTTEDSLPKGHAATHIGMFLAWAALNGLLNDYHEQHSAELLKQLRTRRITGREFFAAVFKEQFAEKDLNVEGNSFAEHYYRNLAGEKGPYFGDYRKILASGLPSFWHVADTWENFDKLAPVISRRFEQWKNPAPRRWWQFWKR
jgi:hypothetical protein